MEIWLGIHTGQWGFYPYGYCSAITEGIPFLVDYDFMTKGRTTTLAFSRYQNDLREWDVGPSM